MFYSKAFSGPCLKGSMNSDRLMFACFHKNVGLAEAVLNASGSIHPCNCWRVSLHLEKRARQVNTKFLCRTAGLSCTRSLPQKGSPMMSC